MPQAALILGDQLFPEHPHIPKSTPIIMREDWELCTRTRHHQQKIVLFLAAMRHHAAELQNQDRTVYYSKLSPSQQSFASHLAQISQSKNIQELLVYNPADPFLLPKIQAALPEVKLSVLPNPSFLTPRETWLTYRKKRRRLLMADFYIEQRQRLNILIENNEPTGGQWSFDENNRKSIPKSLLPPTTPRFPPDKITHEVVQTVSKLFPSHPGNAADFDWPVTRAHALEELNNFIEFRLHSFGPYEDAIHTQNHTLWHSLLSPLINCGLLTPQEIIDRILTTDAPLQSQEGFIRQLIGWREFIFHVAHDYESNQTEFKPFGPARKMAPSWYNGSTGLTPLDHTIKTVLRHGWCHHIERLMVLGSPMLMAGINPDEVYSWFMEHFIDSADWVMAPNVYGMSQFADNGTFATKPYISGSAYILKMSNFARGDWCDTWDGLYWKFIHDHRDRLAKNHRMGMMVSQVEKMDSDRKTLLFNAANQFVSDNTI